MQQSYMQGVIQEGGANLSKRKFGAKPVSKFTIVTWGLMRLQKY
jgi:hypothetical protein